jgi:1,5-anhydro-D-fructose reductase (1,5-anhydro-D-mannitol-forming)
MKIAMIATGRIAETQLAPAIAAARGAQLWSVYSRDQGRAEAFARTHGAASATPAYDNLDALLSDDELDAVLIASPDKLHAPQTIAAVKAGKHVLTEKPMTTDAASAEAMVDAASSAGVKLGVAYHLRWHAGHRALHEAAAAGKFGTLRHMRVQWPMMSDPGNWRANSELATWWCLSGVGTHCLDQIRWFMRPDNGEVTRLTSVINRSVYGGPHEETAVLAMQFESGATAEMCNTVLFTGPMRMEIYGSSGFALCEDTLGAAGAGDIRTHEGAFGFDVRNPFVGEIEDFARAIADDRDPEVNGQEGTRNVQLLLEAIA